MAGEGELLYKDTRSPAPTYVPYKLRRRLRWVGHVARGLSSPEACNGKSGLKTNISFALRDVLVTHQQNKPEHHETTKLTLLLSDSFPRVSSHMQRVAKCVVVLRQYKATPHWTTVTPLQQQIPIHALSLGEQQSSLSLWLS